MGKYSRTDIFKAIIRDGKLLRSGLDGNRNSYRVYLFQGKKMKLTLVRQR